ncbi:acyltransferase family protein [Pseudomonas nitroreducens]|uniref:acyltransferase family protein n=1 Tax=Pseudomonas nitroreducens TaxID=46680 RepID=UPI00209EB0AC|nr:acyltransferase [Pseudomonas nitroreducens]MCP1624160.1 peptidoglycan/LPS O-acetylase OafA/YrhL [Pseudomonas nitroreducens]
MFREFKKIRYLHEFEKVRENNFTIVRFILAYLVLFGHSFPISGDGRDPVSALIVPHAWIGSIAVGGFFAISGFLVSASITNRSPIDFAVSRALRLYPAVIVYSFVAILVIGPMASGVSLKSYFEQNPWVNLWNATLWEWIYNLPFGFPGRPFAGATNGATWTLPAELRCYVMVFLLGCVGVFRSRILAGAVIVLIVYIAQTDYASLPMFGAEPRFHEPLLFFTAGCMYWILRRYIPLNWGVCALLLVSTFGAAGTSVYFYVYIPTVAYCVFMVAYRLPHFDMDRFGDISYGVYIYAWPIQQLVWRPGQSGYLNAAYATLIVIPLAYASWKLVESPALKWRNVLGDRVAEFLLRRPAQATRDA